jgi:hypothetical protein
MLRVDSTSSPVGFLQWLVCETPPKEIVSALFRVFRVWMYTIYDDWRAHQSPCHACAISLQCSKTPGQECEKCYQCNKWFNITMRWSWNIVIFCSINGKGGSFFN